MIFRGALAEGADLAHCLDGLLPLAVSMRYGVNAVESQLPALLRVLR
jgi:hypothetical protein